MRERCRTASRPAPAAPGNGQRAVRSAAANMPRTARRRTPGPATQRGPTRAAGRTRPARRTAGPV
eukprot:7381647-Lingulodinium_polyedra.AAC.1